MRWKIIGLILLVVSLVAPVGCEKAGQATAATDGNTLYTIKGRGTTGYLSKFTGTY